MTQANTATKTAIALRYDGQQAPTISAKGFGHSADEILALAAAHDVHVHEDPQLAAILEQLQLDDTIPPELYLVVAEIIAFVYTLQGRFPKQWTNHHGRVKDKA